jgi:hypothetical protein
VAAVLAVAGLAGCRTNVGTAARVNDSRITESDVNDYIIPGGSQNNGQTVPPRTLVLEFLVQEQIFEQTLRYLAKDHKLPSEGALASYHDAAASVLFQTQLTGRQLDAAIAKGLPKSGVRASFAATYLRASELEYLVIKSQKLNQLSDLVAVVKKAGVHVTVSPRYGTWHVASLSIDGTAPTPGYLSVAPGQQAQPGTK